MECVRGGPVAERFKQAFEVACACGGVVFDAGWNFVEGGAGQEAVLDEGAEPGAERVGADLEPGLQFVETQGAVGDLTLVENVEHVGP